MLSILLSGLGLLLAGLLNRPGTNITITDQPPPRSAPTDTGVWFVCGITEKGPLVPTVVESLTQYLSLFGQRVSYGVLYDALDAFFREGGRRAWVSRVVGPNPVVATRNLNDAGAAVSLVVNAANPGAWANSIKVGVVAGSVGGTFQIQVTDSGAPAVVLDQSPDLTTQADAVAWSQFSNYIRLVLGASALVPAVVAPAALAGGTDDRTNIVDAQWQAALDKFSKDYGPGQVSMPGRTAAAAQLALTAHALPHNRVALIDLPDSSSKSTLLAAVAALRGLDARFAAAFAPWSKIPGLTAGTTRTVPYSAIEAGIIARNDVSLSADYPSAGERGQSQYSLDLSQPDWTQLDRQDLNAAGVNLAIRKFGGIRTYGYRTLVSAASDPLWINFANSRLLMEIAAQCDAVLERHMFDPIDGRGQLFGIIDGEITQILNAFYADNSLYGATPTEAYRVDTGPTVNTVNTIAAREIHATVAVRISEFGEMIELNLVKVAVNDTIA